MGDEERFWFRRSSGEDLKNAANSDAGKAAIAAGTKAAKGGDDDDDDEEESEGDDDDDEEEGDDDDEERFWFRRSSGEDLKNAANSDAGKAAIAAGTKAAKG